MQWNSSTSRPITVPNDEAIESTMSGDEAVDLLVVVVVMVVVVAAVVVAVVVVVAGVHSPFSTFRAEDPPPTDAM